MISTASKASLLLRSLVAVPAYAVTAFDLGHFVWRQKLAAAGLIGIMTLTLSPIPAVAVVVANTVGVSANVPSRRLITATALPFGSYTGAQTDSAVAIIEDRSSKIR